MLSFVEVIGILVGILLFLLATAVIISGEEADVPKIGEDEEWDDWDGDEETEDDWDDIDEDDEDDCFGLDINQDGEIDK